MEEQPGRLVHPLAATFRVAEHRCRVSLSEIRRLHSRGRGSRLVSLAMLATISVATVATGTLFVPAADTMTSRQSLPAGKRIAHVLAATAPEKEKSLKQYDWQTTAEAPDLNGPDLSALPDLPDFDDLPDADGTISASSSVPKGLGTRVRVKKVNLPELPGDADLLPPEPNPYTDGGLGLFQWTGIWVVCLGLVALLGGVLSWAVSRSALDPEFAGLLQSRAKLVLAAIQAVLLGRVLLGQFPKVDTTEMPWAPIHYTTEWLLAPTRAVLKPEAGVDVGPILWLTVAALSSELLCGPAGIFQMAQTSKAGMPMNIRS